jgi:hypothetical protein
LIIIRYSVECRWPATLQYTPPHPPNFATPHHTWHPPTLHHTLAQPTKPHYTLPQPNTTHYTLPHPATTYHTTLCVSLDWLAGQSVGWLVSWLVGWLDGWLVGLLLCMHFDNFVHLVGYLLLAGWLQAGQSPLLNMRNIRVMHQKNIENLKQGDRLIPRCEGIAT